MAATEVWCLIIDIRNELVGTPFQVFAENIASLKEKVKNKSGDDLKNIDAYHLVVRRCKKPKLSADLIREELEEVIKKIDLENKDQIVELTSAQTLRNLELDPNETLLVQIPIKLASLWGDEPSSPPHKKQKTSRADSSTGSLSRSNNAQLSGAVTGPGSNGSQLRFSVDRATCLREATVQGIRKKLEAYQFIWVHAISGSGKTTLAELLYRHVKTNHPSANAMVISLWEEQDRRDWASSLRKLGLKLDNYQQNMTVLIFDEGQTTYPDERLWLDFFKSIQPGSRIYVIVFASERNTLSPLEFATRIQAPAQQTITLRPTIHEDGLPTAGLLFTKEEFNGTIRLRYEGKGSCVFDRTFLDALFEMTKGHIGAITDCLDIIEAHESYKRRKRVPALGSYTWDTFQREFSAEAFMEKLTNNGLFLVRGIPRYSDTRRPAVHQALSTVVQNQYVNTDLDSDVNDGYFHCSRMGWLSSDSIKHASKPQNVYFFASPLHQWLVEWMLFIDLEPPAVPAHNLIQFVENVIRLFNPRMLSNERRIGAGGVQRPPEARYQDEFYRCSHVYCCGSLLSFPEFGTSRGRTDFYVKSKKWGIELLRDGDHLMGHSGRFSSSHLHVINFPVDDYVILDCRTSQPEKHYQHVRNLYHVVFGNDHTFVTILDNKCQKVATFSLEGG